MRKLSRSARFLVGVVQHQRRPFAEGNNGGCSLVLALIGIRYDLDGLVTFIHESEVVLVLLLEGAAAPAVTSEAALSRIGVRGGC